jgi:hypothetical protein
MPKKVRTLQEVAEDILESRVYTSDTGCWLWKPGQWNSGNGYGKVNFEGKPWMVHRLMWTYLVGPIKFGMVLDHKCRERACCNPEHLRELTPKQNTYIGMAVLFDRTRETKHE